MKWAVINAYTEGVMTVRRIAAVFQIAIQSIYRWLTRGPYVNVKPTGRRPKLTHDIVAHVANKVATSKIVDMKHITTSVEKKFQVSISRSSVI